MIYLIELDGVDAGGVAGTVGWCTGTGYVSAATDTPALRVYEPRVIAPGTLERHLWRPGATRGRGEVGYGAVEIANVDGALDHLRDWAFDGRPIRILRGSRRMPRASFEVALSGVVASLVAALDKITIRFRDQAGLIAERLAVTSRYGGTNVLPDGVDGTPADIKGQARPACLGECENLAPVRVNSSKLIYQLSDVGVAEILNVWESGNAITKGVVRANVAALLATAATPGQWDYSLGSATEGAYVRLGSNPSGTITAYVREGPSAAARTAGQVATRLFARAGISASDVLGVAGLDAAAPGVLGWCAASEATIGEALDAVCASVGAAWAPTRSGQFRLLRLTDPAATVPVASLTWTDLIGEASTAIRVLSTTDDDAGVPAYEVALSYQRNWTVMSGAEVVGAVAQARRDWLDQEWRTATVRNAAVWDPDTGAGRHPLSKPLQAQSLLRVEADAQAEAARLLALYEVQRLYLGVTVHAAVAAGLDLGDVVSLAVPRFGLEAGKRFVIVGMVEDFGSDTTDLFLWG